MGGDLEEPLVRGAPLKPIRYVERELTRPDGTKLRAKVPVYPPFRLEDRPAPPAEPEGRKRPDARPQAPGRKKAS
jgi:hypothetical protein